MKKSLVLITGAGGGIGSCISKHLANKYENILLADYDSELLNVVYNQLVLTDANVMMEILDITDFANVKQVIEKYLNEYDISVLVNCAGISVDGTSDIDYSEFQQMMNVNFWGSVNTMLAVVPNMKQQNRGYIINIVSQSAKRARAKTGGYAATKFALIGYIEGLQKELSTTAVKVSALCPGMVNTRQTDDEPDYDKAEMIQPEELLCAVDFLLSIPKNVSVKEVVYECNQQLRRG